jgi:hypothetical protein
MAARLRARRLYSVDAMCEATLKVYADILGSHIPGARVLGSERSS